MKHQEKVGMKHHLLILSSDTTVKRTGITDRGRDTTRFSLGFGFLGNGTFGCGAATTKLIGWEGVHKYKERKCRPIIITDEDIGCASDAKS